MNEREADSMLSFDEDSLFLKLRNKFIFTMPRVVPDQRVTFENDELFRKLSRESEVKYTGFRDRPLEERQLRFQAECREGRADLAFVPTGTNLTLTFSANSWSERPEDRIPTREFVDFDLEPGKVHLKSQFILNGVCVIWMGWVDLMRLDGVGCLAFDEERAQVEDAMLREQIEQNNRRVQEFEERRRQHQQEQERQAASEAETAHLKHRHRSAFCPSIGHHHHHQHHSTSISTSTTTCNRCISSRTGGLNRHHHHHHHHHRHHQLHHNDRNNSNTIREGRSNSGDEVRRTGSGGGSVNSRLSQPHQHQQHLHRHRCGSGSSGTSDKNTINKDNAKNKSRTSISPDVEEGEKHRTTVTTRESKLELKRGEKDIDYNDNDEDDVIIKVDNDNDEIDIDVESKKGKNDANVDKLSSVDVKSCCGVKDDVTKERIRTTSMSAADSSGEALERLRLSPSSPVKKEEDSVSPKTDRRAEEDDMDIEIEDKSDAGQDDVDGDPEPEIEVEIVDEDVEKEGDRKEDNEEKIVKVEQTSPKIPEKPRKSEKFWSPWK